jgi:putative oxidoreductase
LIPTLSLLETVIEATLGLALLTGVYARIVAWSSAILLSSFALTMTISLGILAPLGYGVFTAVGAAFLLGTIAVPNRAKHSQVVIDTSGAKSMTEV